MTYYQALVEGVYQQLSGVPGLAHYGLTPTPPRPTLQLWSQGGLPTVTVSILNIEWTPVTGLPVPIRLGIALVQVRVLCALPLPALGEPTDETPVYDLLHQISSALEGVVSPLGEPAEILSEQRANLPTDIRAVGSPTPRYEHHWILRMTLEAS